MSSGATLYSKLRFMDNKVRGIGICLIELSRWLAGGMGRLF